MEESPTQADKLDTATQADVVENSISETDGPEAKGDSQIDEAEETGELAEVGQEEAPKDRDSVPESTARSSSTEYSRVETTEGVIESAGEVIEELIEIERSSTVSAPEQSVLPDLQTLTETEASEVQVEESTGSDLLGRAVEANAVVEVHNEVESTVEEEQASARIESVPQVTTALEAPAHLDPVSQSPVQPIESTSANASVPPTSPRHQRKRSLDLDDQVFEELTKSSSKKRIPGRLIDQLWEPLDNKNLKSFDRILNISLSKAVERYSSNVQRTTRSQTILFNAWLNENENSFKSRLAVTKVPPTEGVDILNFDSIFRRKRYLETYLSAELKQLNELKRYHNELNFIFEQDSNYLREFTNTTRINSARIKDEVSNRTQLLDLDEEKRPDDVKFTAPETSSFNPNEDSDAKETLELVDKHLTSISENTARLSKFNDQLEMLYNLVEMV